MKKIIGFFVVALAMTLSFSSCASADDQLREAIEVCNKECPIEIENGIYLASFELDGENVEMNVALDRETYGMATLEDYTNAIGAEMEKVMKSSDDEDIKALVDACRETKRGFMVNVMWTDEEDSEVWEYRIAPEEL